MKPIQNIFLFFFVFLFFFLLSGYFFFQVKENASFIPLAEYKSIPSYTNDSIQFYPNMRFPSQNISYNILDCTLQKKDDMLKAFSYLANITVLSFYPVEYAPEITVSCSSEVKESESGFFIAGEGGPLNITSTERYNVISQGKILLLRESSCTQSIIGLHELLHVLGYEHSQNSKSIMYSVSSCSQVLTTDIIESLNALYADPPYPDLVIKNVTANISKGYLQARFIVTNEGLTPAPASKVIVMGENKILETVELDPIFVGYGRIIKIKNIRLFPNAPENLSFVINSSFEEIDLSNNRMTLAISS